ncbi:hypothetical protein RRG08_047315 [Elysia crispata]|uniref:Uncharacterized protein n=1 Tax=Elysia crispata TaxID=231223 RepID=A0AAE0XQJ0_9GAST|nr:hypothetical protein RRG08_047315 [Elysia crispata]
MLVGRLAGCLVGRSVGWSIAPFSWLEGQFIGREGTAIMPSVSTILILGVLLAVTICCQAITMCSYDASLCGFRTEKGVIRLKKYADRYFTSLDPANPHFK